MLCVGTTILPPSRLQKLNCKLCAERQCLIFIHHHNQLFRFPGQKKAASEYGPGAAAAKPASAAPKAAAKAAPAKPAAKEEEEDDDDDLDLFGSDEEEDAENEKLKAQRVAEYNAKKAASKCESLTRASMPSLRGIGQRS